MHLVWPWMLDNTKPKDEYLVFVGKNRDRGIHSRVVKFTFEATRQRVVPVPITQHKNYVDFGGGSHE
jgi:hypothetical protein